MNINGKDIPPDWLVQVKIEAEGDMIAYRHGSVAQVIERDYDEMDMFDCDKYTFDKATLEIRTLPDCPSDEGDKGEYLGSIELEFADKDEPDPPVNTKDLTGCTEMGWGSFCFSIPSIKCEFLNDVLLQKQGIRIGPLYIPINDFDSDNEDWQSGDFEWFVAGESVDGDNFCTYSGLLRELWEDLRYILDHTKKDIPKTFTYIASFGTDMQYEILDIIAHMPEDKRRYIFCEQAMLDDALGTYLSNGIFHREESESGILIPRDEKEWSLKLKVKHGIPD